MFYSWAYLDESITIVICAMRQGMRRILKNTPDEKLKSVDEDFSNVV